MREGSSISPGYRNFHAYSVSGTASSMMGLSAGSSARLCSPISSRLCVLRNGRSLLGSLLAVEHDVVQQRWDCLKLVLRRPEVARGPDNPGPGFGHAGRVVGHGQAACRSRPSEAIVAGSEVRTCTRLSPSFDVDYQVFLHPLPCFMNASKPARLYPSMSVPRDGSGSTGCFLPRPAGETAEPI